MAKKDSESIETRQPVDEELDLPTECAPINPIKLKFDWDESEQETINTIKRAVDQVVMSKFKEALITVRMLLMRVRIPEVDENGVILTDETGAPVWKRNPDGSIVEDYSRLDAVDLDAAILKLSTFSFYAGQDSIDLYMEAVFSKYVADDANADAYSSIIQGTVADKTAIADRKSRDERYFAFFKAYTHRKVKELIDRMDSMRRSLEFVRKMQSEDRNREIRASQRS